MSREGLILLFAFAQILFFVPKIKGAKCNVKNPSELQ
jgi:hypothetical protein